MTTPVPADAEDAVAPAYAERLWPAVWVWVSGTLVAASAGLVFLGFGRRAAVVVAIAAAIAAATALAASSAVVEVADGHLRAGRARMPVSAVGRVAVVDAVRMRALRGPQADARAYLCQRGWLTHGVVVEVLDGEDPVPYWLISSRRPERLAAALESARGEPPSGPADHAHSRHTG